MVLYIISSFLKKIFKLKLEIIGGGSFKMSYQIINTLNPNSKEKLFSTFLRQRSTVNIKVAMISRTNRRPAKNEV